MRADELAGYRLMMTRQSLSGYLSTCAALRDTDFSDVLPTIAVPTLFVVGDQDGSTPPATVEAGSQLVPGARFEVIDDCAHIPSVEQPEALAELTASIREKGVVQPLIVRPTSVPGKFEIVAGERHQTIKRHHSGRRC